MRHASSIDSFIDSFIDCFMALYTTLVINLFTLESSLITRIHSPHQAYKGRVYPGWVYPGVVYGRVDGPCCTGRRAMLHGVDGP